MVKNIIKNKDGKMINIGASLKNIIYVKKKTTIFEALLHVVVKMVNI